MKKTTIVIGFVLLTMTVLQTVYGQQSGAPQTIGVSFQPYPEDAAAYLVASESRQGADSSLGRVKYDFTINGKPVIFTNGDNHDIVMNDGKLSDAEMQLIIIGIDAMKSTLSRGKFEKTPGISFKVEGAALQWNVESQREKGLVFQANFYAMIDRKADQKPNIPIEFKSDSAGNIVMNDGTLSENQTNAIIGGVGMGLSRLSSNSRNW